MSSKRKASPRSAPGLPSGCKSGPTVSQTVARMERDNLVHVQGDRHLELTPEGRTGQRE